MAIVMPRARSSGALSMESNARNSASPFSASTFVMAAVSVVLPWSTWPIVPTFACGLLRSNFPFAIADFPPLRRHTRTRAALNLFCHVRRDLRVVVEFHRVRRAALRVGAQVGRVPEGLRQRDHRAQHARVRALVHAL